MKQKTKKLSLELYGLEFYVYLFQFMIHMFQKFDQISDNHQSDSPDTQHI